MATRKIVRNVVKTGVVGPYPYGAAQQSAYLAKNSGKIAKGAKTVTKTAISYGVLAPVPGASLQQAKTVGEMYSKPLQSVYLNYAKTGKKVKRGKPLYLQRIGL